MLSAGGSETADDTGFAELISELVLSAAEGAAGCDETVLLFAKVLFGAFLQPDTSIAAAKNQSRRFNFTSHIFNPLIYWL